MDNVTDDRIRNLAQPLWESAARPYGVALDFWLMAEQMVLEAMSATARLHNSAIASAPPPSAPVGELLVEAPVARVRELAQCMWESAGRQYGMAQEFWLSAERHVLAMLRASAEPTSANSGLWAAEVKSLAPAAYLERIRSMAYAYWETAGRSYGEAMDCWLRAEREMLGAMAAATERGMPLGAAAVHAPTGGVAADTPAGVVAPAVEPVEAGGAGPDAGTEPSPRPESLTPEAVKVEPAEVEPIEVEPAMAAAEAPAPAVRNTASAADAAPRHKRTPRAGSTRRAAPPAKR